MIRAKPREHSRKPEEIYSSIERLLGPVSRIDLFARCDRRGWDCWGDEVEKFTRAA